MPALKKLKTLSMNECKIAKFTLEYSRRVIIQDYLFMMRGFMATLK